MKKEIKYYLITGAITTAICILLYIQLVTSYNTIWISDAYAQYAALFSKLKDILQNGSSLLYSFQGGLGDGFLGTFFYYLASPFNAILLFFQDIDHFFTVLIWLKAIAISLSALYFFRYHFKLENPLYSIAFSILYVFIGFNVLYFFHIMWLDAVFMLPILLVGIDKFIKKRKMGLYLFSLIYTIITNYYFGYMVCIFSFLYFNYRILLSHSIKKEGKEILLANLSFIVISILGVLCTSFVLLEIINYLPGYARVTTEFLNGESFQFHGNPFTFFQYFLLAASKNVDFLNPDSFFLYMGLFPLVLVILYFFNPNISRKEKVLTFLIILILYLSTSCNYINYAWSGFSKPQFFNGRFTFLFCFFLLYIAYKSLIQRKTLTLKSYLFCAIILLIVLYGFYFTQYDTTILYGNVIFIVAYFLLLYFFNSKKVYIPLLLLTIVCTEMTVNASTSLYEYSFTMTETYEKQNEIYEFASQYIKNYDNSLFYRIETNKTEPYNGPIYYQYNGIDVFLSTISNNIADFFIDIGYGSGATKKNTISYYSGNEVIDSLLGIKYHIFIDDDTDTSDYQLLIQKEIRDSVIKIYENPNALSLGFMVNKRILTVDKDINALDYQNKIFQAMTNTSESIYTSIDISEENGDYFFPIEKNGTICFYTAIDSSNGYQNPTLYLNYHALTKVQDFEIVCTEAEQSEEAYLFYTNLNEDQHLGTFAAYYSQEALLNMIKSLKEQELIITEYTNSRIKGTITSTSDKSILFTTIPYDENWDVYINKKKVETFPILDTLLGVELEEGTFEIEFIYRPKHFYKGLIISLFSFILLIATSFVQRKKSLRH